MSEERHQGSFTPGPLLQPADPRVTELDISLRSIEEISRQLAPGLLPARDPNRVNILTSKADDFIEVDGTIIHSLAMVGWYKVQTTRFGWIPACDAVSGSYMPLGPTPVGAIPPGSRVRVKKSRSMSVGLITSVVPYQLNDGTCRAPDWITQGGQAGMLREALHMQPLTGTYRQGGVKDFSGGRPVDSTSMEKGWISATGIAITIDDFQAQVRVNELTGLFLSYFDSHTRLAGVNLDLQSAVHEITAKDDEGESYHFHGIATYPWEALGLYSKGTSFVVTTSDDEVQLTSAKAKIDLESGDVQPIYRYQEYGGYLGQGHFRSVIKPAKESGVRKESDQDADVGLFQESIGLDGTYSLAFAKSGYIGKRSVIVAPKVVQRPESGKGDDADKSEYDFTGESHKIGDVQVSGEQKAIQRLAGVDDLIAYSTNWRALHPFHYHEKDFKTPQEGESKLKTQGSIDFGELNNQAYLSDPEPIQMKIDPRYNDVEYFERHAFLYFAEDGGVILTAGSGESLVLGGGKARLSAPGDVEICPGRNHVVLADQVLLRGRTAIDLSAAQGDVRLKSEKNMQLVAGNGGQGGLLLESKADGRTQTYKDKIGDEVEASGIVLKSKDGFIGSYATEIYLRTGGDSKGGNIVIDANKGDDDVIITTKEFNVYAQKEANFYFGPKGETSKVKRVYHFGDKLAVMDVQLFIGGKLIGFNGGGGSAGVVVDGGVYATKAIATAGVMADRKGMFLGKVPGGFAGTVQQVTEAAADAAEQFKSAGEKRHDADIVQRYYKPDLPGDDETIKNIGFSYRDDQDGKQYGTKDFLWLESRWQAMARLGMATGASTTWEEPVVEYQGRELMPWPGKKNWQDSELLLQIEALTMFDPEAGHAKDRPGPYENPSLASLSKAKMAEAYKLVAQ